MGTQRIVAITDGTVDLGRELVARGGLLTPLTTREAALFGYLASRPGEVVSREQLQTEVWGYAAAVVSRTVDTTVRRLRTKIELDPAQPAHLQTVHGQGYRFQPLRVAGVDRVGRQAELAAITAALADHHRVGVVGAAGVGKSLLLREVAERQSGRAVVLIDAAGTTRSAAPAEAGRDLALRIAAAAGISVGDDPVRQVGAAMQVRGGLWVIDGVEPGALEALCGWRVRILVSTRERRPIPGIAWVEIGPLPLDDAAALFVARARAADPAFAASPERVAAIVDRLDRLPLAIELAAARAHVLGPVALLERLDEPVRVLGRGNTLERAFQAAWDGLTPEERTVLAQCAVFEGPFPLDAAEAVVAEVPPTAVVDALSALRDRSLVLASRESGELRFSLLHAVRSLAAPQQGDRGGLLRRRAQWLAGAGGEAVAALDGAGASAAVARLRDLRRDLVSAVELQPGMVARPAAHGRTPISITMAPPRRSPDGRSTWNVRAETLVTSERPVDTSVSRGGAIPAPGPLGPALPAPGPLEPGFPAPEGEEPYPSLVPILDAVLELDGPAPERVARLEAALEGGPGERSPPDRSADPLGVTSGENSRPPESFGHERTSIMLAPLPIPPQGGGRCRLDARCVQGDSRRSPDCVNSRPTDSFGHVRTSIMLAPLPIPPQGGGRSLDYRCVPGDSRRPPVCENRGSLPRSGGASTPHQNAERADLLRRLSCALRVVGRPAEALSAANAALAVATADGRAEALVAAAFAEAPGLAAARAREALALSPRPATAVLAWLAVARDERRAGARAGCEQALRRALEVVRAAPVPRLEAAVLSNLANVRRERGRVAEAEVLYRRAHEVGAALGQARAAASAMLNLGGLLAERGDLLVALGPVREALAAARAAGEGLLVAHALHTLGYLLHRLDRLDEAEPAYVEAIGLLRGPDPELAASALGDLGALQADLDRVEEAERTLAEAEEGIAAADRPALGVHRAHIDLALARQSAGAARERLLQRAVARLHEAEAARPQRATMAIQLTRARMQRSASLRERGAVGSSGHPELLPGATT
jgi:DNA-binding winged helix-turn-helix (wHTH) protein/tetratricopeptide (TPR) repeat protein